MLAVLEEQGYDRMPRFHEVTTRWARYRVFRPKKGSGDNDQQAVLAIGYSLNWLESGIGPGPESKIKVLPKLNSVSCGQDFEDIRISIVYMHTALSR